MPHAERFRAARIDQLCAAPAASSPDENAKLSDRHVAQAQIVGMHQ